MDANFFMITRTDTDTDRDDLRVLESLDVAADSLQRQGKVEKSLGYMQMAFKFRRRLYGDRSEETTAYCRSLLKAAMTAAGQHMESGDGTRAVSLLEEAQQAVSGLPLEPFASDICSLYNSLALAYRRKGDLHAAKRHIAKALQIAESFPSAHIDRAAAYLNMCVLLSTLKQHRDALASGLKAVQFAQEDLVTASLSGPPAKSEKISVLAVAYHNVGVEQEHLNRMKEAVEWYSRASRLLEGHGRNPDLQAQVSHTLKAALQSLGSRDKSPETLLWKRKSQRSAESTPRLVASAQMHRSKSGKHSVRQLTSPRKTETVGRSRGSETVPFSCRERDDTPPSVYQQFALSNAVHSPTIPPIDISETDQDIRDLEAMGLLEYSLDTGRPTPRAARPTIVRVRGRKRGLLRYQSETSTRKGRSPEESDAQKRAAIAVDSWDEEDHPQPLNIDELSKKSKKTPATSPKTALKSELSKPLFEMKPLAKPSKIELKPHPPAPRAVPEKPAEPLNSPDQEMEKAALVIQNAFRNRKLKKKEPKKPAKAQAAIPTVTDKSPEVDRATLEKAALAIQKRVRCFLARKRADLLRKRMQKQGRKVLHRGCRRLQDRSFVTIEVVEENLQLEVVATDTNRVRRLVVPKPTTLTPADIAMKVDTDAKGELQLPANADPELTKAAVSIQAIFRGKKAREKIKLERAAPVSAPNSSAGLSSLLRYNPAAKPKDLLQSLMSTKELQLSIPFDVAGKTPEELSSAIEREIIPRISIEGGRMVLEPKPEVQPKTEVEQKAEAPPKVELLPGDEQKITLMQSLFRMKQQKQKYMKKKAEEDVSKVLAKGEKEIQGGRYLVTFVLKIGDVVEVDAYPLTKGSKKPQKCEQSLNEVLEALSWPSDQSWSAHESEALAAVTIQDSKVVIASAILFQVEDDLGTAELFTITVKRDPPWIVISAQPKQVGTPAPRSLTAQESELRELAGVDEEWAPVYWRDVLSRVQLTAGNTLALSQLTQPPPAIVVLTTTTANVLGTELYQRIEAERPVVSPVMMERAAERVQRWFRAAQARRELRERKERRGLRELRFRTCHIVGGRALIVQIYENMPFWTVETVDTNSLTSSSETVGEGKPLDWVKTKFNQSRVPEAPNESTRKTLAVIKIQKVIRGILVRKRTDQVRNDARRKLRFTRRKLINSEEFFISIYEVESIIEIEIFKVSKPLQLKYHTKLIKLTQERWLKLYGEKPTLQVLYEDVTLVSGEIKLKAMRRLEGMPPDRNLLPNSDTSPRQDEARTIMRASKKLDSNMWVVTMSIIDAQPKQEKPHPNDTLEFGAFCGCMEGALKVADSLGHLSEVTGQPIDAVYPIGFLVINHLLRVQNNKLIFDFSAPLPDVMHLITLVQAQIRGFLARKRVKYQVKEYGLITCAGKEINGERFILYAHNDPRGIVLEAARRTPKQSFFCLLEGEAVADMPENINRKKVIEGFVFPRLELVEENGKVVLRIAPGNVHVPTEGIEAYVFKPKTAGKLPDFRTVRRANTIIKSLLETKPKQLADWLPGAGSPPCSPTLSREAKACVSLKLPDKETGGSKPVFEVAEEAEDKEEDQPPKSSVSRFFPTSISPVIPKATIDSSPIAKSIFSPAPAHRPQLSSTELSMMLRRSSAKAELIVRSGLELLGELYTASVYDNKAVLLVEVLQMRTKEEMRRETPMPTFSSTDERDQYCSELLNRISIAVDEKGQKRLEIAPAADSLQVLYRRSHYISDRYTVVTVTETTEELVLWVFDPAKNSHLRLPIAKKRETEMENIQKEILQLVKRIQIESVLGHEALVLAPA